MPIHLIKSAMVALLLFSLFACSNGGNESPEQQVKNSLAAMEAAIEARNISTLFEHISDAYQDHKGNDKTALRRLAQLYLFKNQRVGVVTSITALNTIDANTVAVEASLLMGSKSSFKHNLLPQIRADSQQISAVFKYEKKKWKIISLSWQNQGRY